MAKPKILPITNDDLYRVLAGRTMTVRTKDGQDVALRLYTPDELLLLHAEIALENDEKPSMTYAQAENLTRSHDLYVLLENINQYQYQYRNHSNHSA